MSKGRKKRNYPQHLPSKHEAGFRSTASATAVMAAIALLLVAVAVLARPLHTRAALPPGPKLYKYKVVRSYPHDPEAFTQGLQFHRECTTKKDAACKLRKECKDMLWESTGMYGGRSTIRKVDLATGEVLQRKRLHKADFAEGLTRFGDRLYQLTWMRPLVYAYDVSNFTHVRRMKTQLSDGWGLTTDGLQLIATDSSDQLYFLDPEHKGDNTLRTVRQVTVTDQQRPVRWVNELEWINGHVWGNVWQTNCLAKIDPETGVVAGWALLHGLDKVAREEGGDQNPAWPMDVLNGIAWDEEKDRWFVTGKQWPRLFEVVLSEVQHKDRKEAQRMLQEARQACIK